MAHQLIRKFKLVLFIIPLLFIGCHYSSTITLVKDGSSDYKIVIPDSADSIVELAAKELQGYLKEISNVMVDIVSTDSGNSGKSIHIGIPQGYPDLADQVATLDEDGFIIHTREKNLILAGGADKGSLYAVYTFLEEVLGCRKLSPEVEIIPDKKTIRIPRLNITQEPAFEFRELHMLLPRTDKKYRDWHKLDLKEGKNEWGMFVHTFDDLVPAEKYFEDHPEYFSFLNVRRIPDGQLCLSNPDVFVLVTKGLSEKMAEKPDALYWSVSQNDTYKACECDSCRKEYEVYGGYSGAMIHFVNKVAERFPEKVISTLAYQYTRAAPDNIKPLDNVNIMFCSIECNRSRPLSTDPSSASFRKDTEDWCRLTNNIFMWDYVVQFRNLVSPFPNFRVLQPNLKYFRDQGMKMMFQQGSGGLVSEFIELRSYIIAKLLWNPDADVDKIMNDFVHAYYGKAGEYILDYIVKMHDALDKSGGDLGIYGYPFDGINTYLTPGLMSDYELLFDRAEKAVSGDPEKLWRVQVARLPLEFAIIDISLRNFNDTLSFFEIDGQNWNVKENMLERLEKLTKNAKKAGITRYWEHGNFPDDYQKTVERYVKSSMQKHLALFKKVKLNTSFSDKYPVGGASALTDGLKGINDYHFNWLGFEGPDLEAVVDLETEQMINKVGIDFLQEIKSWVFLPQKIDLFISSDGENFRHLKSKKNEIPASRKGTFIESFELVFEPATARYVKVVAKNMGVCPDWHPGATYPAWIFCDEILIW